MIKIKIMNESYIESIKSAIERLLERKRVVFWYDERGEFSEYFNKMTLDGVRKEVLDNNAFSIKYRALMEYPSQRLIIYSEKAAPSDEDNWLLDLQLSGEVFYADLNSLYAGECFIPMEFRTMVVDAHSAFFKVQENRSALSGVLGANPKLRSSVRAIEWEMLSIISKTNGNMDDILFILFEQLSKDKDTLYKKLVKFGLEELLWNEINSRFSYSESNGIKDLIIVLFQADFEHFIGGYSLSADALIFMNKWKDSAKYRECFKYWSDELSKSLNIPESLLNYNIESLLKVDTFKCVDWCIISELRNRILNNTILESDVQRWVNERSGLLFYDGVRHTMEALLQAEKLLSEIRRVDLSMASAEAAFTAYYKQWYVVDMYYRNYFQELSEAENLSVLEDVTKMVQDTYTNSYLLPLNNNWQDIINHIPEWRIDRVFSQKFFYSTYVKPYLRQNKRIFVIISDGLRYESAKELESVLAGVNMCNVTSIPPMLGAVPSYTQLGMAALLPHRELSFENESDVVFADGISTLGTDQRTKVLQKAHPRSVAITAKDFMDMNSSTTGREFVKDYDVLYIYSNIIDKSGDDITSESKVFSATNDEFEHLSRLVKHINNCNGTNILITADHGYIYQNEKLAESDFADFSSMGDAFKVNRRFVLGKNLINSKAVKTWRSEDLSLKSGVMVQIPNSINRIRVQGAGSRYVHGGTSLQEIVIPIIEINRKRISDISVVDVDVLTSSSRITSGRITLGLYQTTAVSDKVKARALRFAFYDDNGNIISDTVNLNFDSSSSDTVSREKKHTFIFSNDISNFNGKEAVFKMEELISGSNHYTTYKSVLFKISILLTPEF